VWDDAENSVLNKVELALSGEASSSVVVMQPPLDKVSLFVATFLHHVNIISR